VAWLVAFLMGAEHLTDHDETLPGDLVWGQMIESGLSVAAGRVDRPIHERERIRISLLARLADALIRPPVG
jgi:hypothetical protein